MSRLAATLRLVLAAVVVAATGSAAAAGAPPQTRQSDFALAWGPGGAGPNHLSGPGLDGKWAGWTLSIDYVESSDCWTDCWVQQLSWRLSSGANAVWGTCEQDAYGLCRAYINDPSGTAQFAVTVTGGTGRYSGVTGTGLVTGPTGSALFVPCCPDPVTAAAVVQLRLTLG